MTVAFGPFAVNVLDPPPVIVKGVELESFKVPFWFPLARVRVGPKRGTVTKIIPPFAVTVPEPSANTP